MSYPQRVSLIDPTHGILSVREQAKLLAISRSSIYYEPAVSEDDIRAMHAIDEIFTECPFYGSRRIRWTLEHECHLLLCRERVQRLMRQMGLQAIYPRSRRSLSTPGSDAQTYPYLLKNLAITHPNQVWGADITYVRLEKGFAYLVAIIDWYSRYVVSWQLSPTLEIDFCLAALERALAEALPDIHNSDQGSHFTSPQYLAPLLKSGIRISMDGRGRCMDNIFTERLWRTVKYEDIYLRAYEQFRDAQRGLASYFTFYNTKRPHQSLGYKTPAAAYGKN